MKVPASSLTTEKIGPTRLVQANPEHPLYAPLAQVVLATYGPPAVIAREFDGLEGTQAVLLFGSWAARYLGQPGRAPNDIDVLVIGSPDRDAVDDAAERAERAIGLPLQATVRSRSQWSAARDSFIQEVKRRPLVVVLAADDIGDAVSNDRWPREVPAWAGERGRADIERLLNDGVPQLGAIVHLRVLPGALGQYRRLVDRVGA